MAAKKQTNSSMTKRISISVLVACAAVLVASLIIIMGVLYDYFGGIERTQLADELEIAAAAVEEGGTDALARLSSERYRLTLIAKNGDVLYDTKAGSPLSENHAERSEVKEALKTGDGESTRYSATFMEKTVYRAKRLDDGSVLRISLASATVGLLAVGLIQPILFVALIALVLSIFLAKRLSKSIVAPLNDLDLEHPLDNETYPEISPLLGRINRQNIKIAEQMENLKRKTDEFGQITENMREGLVLLDDKGTVLSINRAAKTIFGAGDSSVGLDFLAVERSHEVSSAVEEAFASGHSDARIERNGRVYSLDIDRTVSDGKVLGTLILVFDITDKESAERMRREFTANVSHELKTPLQGIIGSADLIREGLVKPEDMPHFIGRIHDEAERLVTLIEDIIRLSRLDEGGNIIFDEKSVNLGEVAAEAVKSLGEAAKAKNIAVTLDDKGAAMRGSSRLLYEIVYNLCDNAIKYGREGGYVHVTVESEDGKAVLTVKDNGIGIAPEHQARVFERFYRVDKSRSRESGGTGLGLSIVKHAVAVHHGEISLDSRLGEGTEIKISFPI